MAGPTIAPKITPDQAREIIAKNLFDEGQIKAPKGPDHDLALKFIKEYNQEREAQHGSVPGFQERFVREHFAGEVAKLGDEKHTPQKPAQDGSLKPLIDSVEKYFRGENSSKGASREPDSKPKLQKPTEPQSHKETSKPKAAPATHKAEPRAPEKDKHTEAAKGEHRESKKLEKPEIKKHEPKKHDPGLKEQIEHGLEDLRGKLDKIIHPPENGAKHKKVETSPKQEQPKTQPEQDKKQEPSRQNTPTDLNSLEKFFKASGYKWPGVGETALIGIRSEASVTQGADAPKGSDSLLIVKHMPPDAEHKTDYYSVKRIECSTVPTIKDGKGLAPDVNGDNKPDIATVLPGQYVVHMVTNGHGTKVMEIVGGAPANRDTNQNGRIDADEKGQESLASHVQIHPDTSIFRSEVSKGTSVGCTVLPIDEATYNEKVLPLLQGNSNGMSYAIVEATELSRYEEAPAFASNDRSSELVTLGVPRI